MSKTSPRPWHYYCSTRRRSECTSQRREVAAGAEVLLGLRRREEGLDGSLAGRAIEADGITGASIDRKAEDDRHQENYRGVHIRREKGGRRTLSMT